MVTKISLDIKTDAENTRFLLSLSNFHKNFTFVAFLTENTNFL